jgi:hypothetical protein
MHITFIALCVSLLASAKSDDDIGVFSDDPEPQTASREPVGDENYDVAMKAAKAGEWDTAIRSIQKFLRSQPDHCVGLRKMAEFNADHGNIKTGWAILLHTR